MNDKTKSSPVSKVSARRRLIRGAFAAPAVLALHTGNAMATSSPMRCAVSNATPPPSSGSTDAYAGSVWVRTQLWYQNGTGKYYMKGADLPQGLCTSSTKPANGYFHEFDVVNNRLSTTVAATTTTPANLTKSSNPKWVALRFDSNGKIVTVGHSTSGTVVTASCWSSFAAP